MYKAITFFFILLICVNPSFSEDLKKEGFFEKNFAKSPLDQKEPRRIEKTNNRENASKEESKETKPVKPISIREGDFNQEKSGGSIAELTKTIPVVGISAILNTLDKKHFLEKLNELIEVATKYDLLIKDVYTIGDMANLQDLQSLLPVLIRGGDISALGKVPEKYSTVKSSPTWILHTKEGEILLEGTGPLGANFNEKGEFLDKPRL